MKTKGNKHADKSNKISTAWPISMSIALCCGAV